jgi:hypothetical protein
LLQGTCYASTSAQGTNARGENGFDISRLTYTEMLLSSNEFVDQELVSGGFSSILEQVLIIAIVKTIRTIVQK